MNHFPSVTVAIPTYNEAYYIESVIQRFFDQGYPNLVEILVADGNSNDGTQDIVRKISLRNSKVRLLDNPQRIQSTALNIMLQEAKADIFLRADAHSEYSLDYVQSCVKTLLSSGALNVGGAQRFVAKTPFQAGVALASRSFLGNGGAKYRDPNYDGYAETVFIGCFWRKDLLSSGGFSVDAVTNQDAEINLRLLKRQENAIYISSEIKVWYYPRNTYKALWKQFFKYGRGRYLTAKKHPGKSPVRTKLPALACLFLAILFFITYTFGNIQGTLLLAFIVLMVPLLESIRVAIKQNSNFEKDIWRGLETQSPSFLSRCFYCWVSLLIMPVAYSMGGAFQLIRHKITGVEGW